MGVDDLGILYGRNLIIDAANATYQNAKLDEVKKIDCAAIKEAFCKICGINSNDIDKFLVFGELMCNPGYYEYAKEGLNDTY